MWNPIGAPSDPAIDSFITAVKAIGLYGRACDPASCQQEPLLINSATAACRDCTLQFAHDVLYKADFDVQKAMALLMPGEWIWFDFNARSCDAVDELVWLLSVK